MPEKRIRIYEVLAAVRAENGVTAWKPHLIEARSPAAARDLMAARYVGSVSLPDGRRVAELMGSGVKVERSGEAE